MFLITAVGNLGNDPKIQETPFRHLKFSVAVQAGWGERKETVWVNLKADERRFGTLLGNATKGVKVSLVCRVTGVSEDRKSFFADLVDITSMASGNRPAAVGGGSFDEDMPF